MEQSKLCKTYREAWAIAHRKAGEIVTTEQGFIVFWQVAAYSNREGKNNG